MYLTLQKYKKNIQNALFYYNPPLKTHYSPQKLPPFLFPHPTKKADAQAPALRIQNVLFPT